MRYGYLVVEGQHDAEFVGRLLRLSGFARIKQGTELDPAWSDLTKLSFPHEGDLTKRIPVPAFFQKADYSIAVDSAEGETRLAQTLEESLLVLQPTLSLSQLTGVGLILDADAEISPPARWTKLRALVQQKVPALALPAVPGEVSPPVPEKPRCGGFVFPDNASAGTLEKLLLACSEQMYPDLHYSAVAYIDGLDLSTAAFTSDDRKQIKKPAGRDKAVISAIAGVLRPSKSIAVSLSDNRWLDAPALALPRVQAVRMFLVKLLGL